MSQLTVTIDLEDYTAGLTGKLDLNGFSGYGEGWSNLSEIENFCDSLEQVVNKVEGKTELIAGQRERKMDKPKFVHFLLGLSKF